MGCYIECIHFIMFELNQISIISLLSLLIIHHLYPSPTEGGREKMSEEKWVNRASTKGKKRTLDEHPEDFHKKDVFCLQMWLSSLSGFARRACYEISSYHYFMCESILLNTDSDAHCFSSFLSIEICHFMMKEYLLLIFLMFSSKSCLTLTLWKNTDLKVWRHSRKRLQTGTLESEQWVKYCKCFGFYVLSHWLTLNTESKIFCHFLYNSYSWAKSTVYYLQKIIYMFLFLFFHFWTSQPKYVVLTWHEAYFVSQGIL